MVFDAQATAVSWKNGLKAKAIQARDAGILPAFTRCNFTLDQYWIGGADTVEEGLSWPPDAPESPPEEPPA